MTDYNEINLDAIKWIARNGDTFQICTEATVLSEKQFATPVYSYRPSSDTVKRVAGENKINTSVKTKAVETVHTVTKRMAQVIYNTLVSNGVSFNRSDVGVNQWSMVKVA